MSTCSNHSCICDCVQAKLDRMDDLRRWAKSRKWWIEAGHADRPHELIFLKAVLELLSGKVEA